MKKDNVVQEKSYAFALECIKLYQMLTKEKREFILSKQLLRSTTSIGANVEEAIGGQSTRDFLSKMSIAYKETREAHYWLRLLRDSENIEKKDSEMLISKCDELLRLIGSIQKTIKSKLDNS
ncbi:MAG: four helix bundle protein [Flavobacteriaceae bacterium]